MSRKVRFNCCLGEYLVPLVPLVPLFVHSPQFPAHPTKEHQ